MATGAQVWSTTASQNSTADTNVNFAEGMAPSQVNDSARALMASEAKWIADNNGSLVTGGTTTAFTVTTNQVAAALTGGYTMTLRFHATPDSSATIAQDGLAAEPIQVTAGTNITFGDLSSNQPYTVTYLSSLPAWVVRSAGSPINSIPYGKIQQESATTLLGNPTGSLANVQEVGIGSGLVVSGTNLTAPAFPPTTAFKNLVIKVTGASSATATADFVTMATANSSAFQTVAVNGSVSISSSVSGAAGGLDTGAPATGTFYAIWAISTAASTLAQLLASTSFTTPLLPGAYTYKARIGALVTSTSTVATALLGTWQFGRQTAYKVGLGSTLISTQYLFVLNGGTGSWPTGISVTQYLPTTANRGTFLAETSLTAGQTVGVAASTSVSNPTGSLIGDFTASATAVGSSFTVTLESSNIYYGTVGGGSLSVLVRGWEDNI